MEHYLPLFYGQTASLFDYLPKGTLIGLDHLSGQAREERLAHDVNVTGTLNLLAAARDAGKEE